MRIRAWILFSGVLVSLGLAIFAYKAVVLDYPLTTRGQPGVWRIELSVNVTGEGSWTTVEISLPPSTGAQQLMSEHVRSGLLGFSISEEDSNRYGRWTGELRGTSTMSYQSTVETRLHDQVLPARDAQSRYSADTAVFLEASPGIRAGDPFFIQLSTELALADEDKVELAQSIYGFVSREIGASLNSEAMEASAVVQEGRGNPLGRARLFCALARTNGLPCRVVMGLNLSASTPEDPEYWNEAYLGSGWVSFDVVERRIAEVPADRVILSTRDHTPVRASGARVVSHRFFVQSESQAYGDLLRRRLSESDNPIDRYSILLLPIRVQQSLRLLVLVPLGALVMTLLRNMAGLRTFGMFMPMLIALAMTATGLVIGSTVFVGMIAFALLSRLLIQRFYLLLAARVAFILTLVVMMMVVSVVMGDRLGTSLAGVTAFPLVIMTMIVERISVSLEEEGVGNTLRRIGGTLLAIYVTYGVIHAELLQTLFLVFPELIISILGLLVAVGRYTGYRLSELIRFRTFGGTAVARRAPIGVLEPAEAGKDGRA
jgi:hypothetical protein